jgi:Flp pilus assembly protein TadG
MVEAAIITPLLVLLTFAIVDFSALFYVYLALENGVSQAVRYGITGQTATGAGGAAMTRVDSIKAKMREKTPTLTIPDNAFAFSFQTPGSASWTPGVGGPNTIQRVQVSYTWQFYTPLIAVFFDSGQIALSVSSTMRNEGFTE